MKKSLFIILLSLLLILTSCTFEDFTKSPNEIEDYGEIEEQEKEIIETIEGEYWLVTIGATDYNKLYSQTKEVTRISFTLKKVTKLEEVSYYFIQKGEECECFEVEPQEEVDGKIDYDAAISSTIPVQVQEYYFDTQFGFDIDRLSNAQKLWFERENEMFTIYLVSTSEVVIEKKDLATKEELMYYLATDEVKYPINYQSNNVYNPSLSACYGEDVIVLYPYQENMELSIMIDNQQFRVTDVVTIDNVDYYQYTFEMPMGAVEISFMVLFVAIPINPPVCYKPVIYLYPEVEMDLTIQYDEPEMLLTTYPKYQDGWSMHVLPNGVMYDEAGRSYYALYFEEIRRWDCDFTEGFLVQSSDAQDFLEEKLTILGFNEREANEFIMYWLSTLENNEYSLVYFETTELRSINAPLSLSAEPDSMLRVIMHVKAAGGTETIIEEELPSFERTGFTLVEWGGTIY